MIVITEEMSPKTMFTSARGILTLKDLSCVHNDLTTIWKPWSYDTRKHRAQVASYGAGCARLAATA